MLRGCVGMPGVPRSEMTDMPRIHATIAPAAPFHDCLPGDRPIDVCVLRSATANLKRVRSC